MSSKLVGVIAMALLAGIVVGAILAILASPSARVKTMTATGSSTPTVSETLLLPTTIERTWTATKILIETVVKTQTVTETVISEAISTATSAAEYLLVLCSPPAVQNTWKFVPFGIGNESVTNEAETGKLFVGFYVRVENHNADKVYVGAGKFRIVVDNKYAYDPLWGGFSSELDHFEGVWLLNGGVAEGWVLFEIPEDKANASLTLEFASLWFDGNIEYGELPKIEPP